jgi:gluconolactonase
MIRDCLLAVIFIMTIANAVILASAGAAEPAFLTIGNIDSMSDEFGKIVPRDAKIEVLASGFTWTEGPVWVGGDDDGHLLFCDIPRNMIFKWHPKNGITVFMNPSGYTGVTYYGLEPGSNGLALDPKGNLCMCEHGDRRVSVLTPGGGKMTLADRFDGKRLNSPNDLVFAKDGTMYFTDPPYGLPDRENDARRELDFCGVYRLSTDGRLTLVTKSLDRPNGLGLSPDEKTLVVAQSDPAKPTWTTFALGTDGIASPTAGISGKTIADASSYIKQFQGLPDGLTVSKSGMIYASGPGGIYVMNFDGKILGRITTGRKTSNCVLSPDEKTLYITADDVLCRVRL